MNQSSHHHQARKPGSDEFFSLACTNQSYTCPFSGATPEQLGVWYESPDKYYLSIEQWLDEHQDSLTGGV